MVELTKEELRELKKAINALICNRLSFRTENEAFAIENDKYLSLDRELLKKVLKEMEMIRCKK